MLVESTNKDALVVNRLPDGSRVVVDAANETVLALNATAGSAWDACSQPTTLSGVTEHMRRSLDPGTTEAVAERAILELEAKKLVRIFEAPKPTRRQMLGTLSAAAALPLVVSLTLANQKAYAKATVSPTPVPKKPTPPPIFPFW